MKTPSVRSVSYRTVWSWIAADFWRHFQQINSVMDASHHAEYTPSLNCQAVTSWKLLVCWQSLSIARGNYNSYFNSGKTGGTGFSFAGRLWYQNLYSVTLTTFLQNFFSYIQFTLRSQSEIHFPPHLHFLYDFSRRIAYTNVDEFIYPVSF